MPGRNLQHLTHTQRDRERERLTCANRLALLLRGLNWLMVGTLSTETALEPNWYSVLPKPGQKVHTEIKGISDSHLHSAFYPSGSKQAHNVFITGLSVWHREKEAERGSLMVNAGCNFVIGTLLSFNWMCHFYWKVFFFPPNETEGMEKLSGN